MVVSARQLREPSVASSDQRTVSHRMQLTRHFSGRSCPVAASSPSPMWCLCLCDHEPSRPTWTRISHPMPTYWIRHRPLPLVLWLISPLEPIRSLLRLSDPIFHHLPILVFAVPLVGDLAAASIWAPRRDPWRSPSQVSSEVQTVSRERRRSHCLRRCIRDVSKTSRAASICSSSPASMVPCRASTLARPRLGTFWLGANSTTARNS